MQRRSYLAGLSAIPFLGLGGCLGIGGPDGTVNSEIDGVTVSDVDVNTVEDYGTELQVVSAVVHNENEHSVHIETSGQFYDENGAELETRGGDGEIDADTKRNTELIGTDRVDAVDRYEVRISEYEGW